MLDFLADDVHPLVDRLYRAARDNRAADVAVVAEALRDKLNQLTELADEDMMGEAA